LLASFQIFAEKLPKKGKEAPLSLSFQTCDQETRGKRRRKKRKKTLKEPFKV
jgi:hypothetical protein